MDTTLLISGFVIFTVISTLAILFVNKRDRVKQLENALRELKKSFAELDEQAKLIIRTDLELNKAQEELDRRLNGLDALQKASHLISTTLDEDEILHRLDQSFMTELGFEKNLIAIKVENNKLISRIAIGFSNEDIRHILDHLDKDKAFLTSLTQGHTFSSINSPKQRKETLSQVFDVEHFVISPIVTQSGMLGLVFVGNRSNTSPVTVGDEELTSILANQIGQSLENARLFEQVYRSSQELESKVHDRTKELATALEEVKRISKTKSEFISAVSHELRTPLTSIKGYASLLMTGKLGDVPDSVKERLSKINLHSDNLVKLINDLLDIARIESGRMEMNIGKCNAAKLIENVHDLLTPQMRDKNINWAANVSPGIPEMQLDASQVERVFINLIGNAIKFTPVNGTISVKAILNKDPSVTFEVSDTGIGISEEDKDKIFNEFYRVENTINENVKGTGLGLPLAKKIIEAHNGNIRVTSKVNQGTTFHLTLPIANKKSTT